MAFLPIRRAKYQNFRDFIFHVCIEIFTEHFFVVRTRLLRKLFTQRSGLICAAGVSLYSAFVALNGFAGIVLSIRVFVIGFRWLCLQYIP